MIPVCYRDVTEPGPYIPASMTPAPHLRRNVLAKWSVNGGDRGLPKEYDGGIPHSRGNAELPQNIA
jgi:hypothetical protein